MNIRLLIEADAPAFVALRSEALEREPQAFSRSPEDELAQTPESAALRLQALGDGNFVLGAFTETELVGMVGLRRDLSLKVRHKARVWGMYVSNRACAQGVGRTLLSELICCARTYPGLEQLILGVAITQSQARSLYRSLGFESFGLEHRSLKIDTGYLDEEHLVLWLDRSR